MSISQEVLSSRVTSTLALTATVPIARFLLERLVYRPLAWHWLASPQQKQDLALPLKLQHRMLKLMESLWKMTAYMILLSIGIYALHDQKWALQTDLWWRGYPHQTLSRGVEVYYNAELAFYGASAFMLLVWEERRHDFLVMLAHHLVTIVLIAFSYVTGYTRIGAMVMLLHDPSDIFLEAAKIFSYIGRDGPATTMFATLLISWFVLRLLLFPFWLIGSAIFELPAVLGRYPPYSLIFVGMLCALVCMHVYWFTLIAKIAWGKLMTGEAHDTREDDD